LLELDLFSNYLKCYNFLLYREYVDCGQVMSETAQYNEHRQRVSIRMC